MSPLRPDKTPRIDPPAEPNQSPRIDPPAAPTTPQDAPKREPVDPDAEDPGVDVEVDDAALDPIR